jgi:EAL domain-containing protein (putative c-di-GMP-specific phosphodiesterase class I)
MLSPEPVPVYHERLDEIEVQLAERGSLGLLVLDASRLGAIEDAYGETAYGEVRGRLFTTLGEQRGKDYRSGDILVLDRPRGTRLLFFLDRKRRKALPFTLSDLRSARLRVLNSLVPNLSRCGFPFTKSAPRLDVGWGLLVHNPLVHVQHTVDRGVAEAQETVELQRRTDALSMRERLQDVLLRERVTTALQPILHLVTGRVLGYEALSRAPRGSGFESADALFALAAENDLVIELDRLCRKRALLSSGRVPSSVRLFINTLPATLRDPQFRGRALVDFLDKAQIAPERIVIEITEKLVIENYGLFRETMAYFSDLGMHFAVDDVGAGYSGLEAIARLKPDYLKIDMALVRDVHASPVNQAMVKAIVSLGQGTGATVIAEGIHSDDEVRSLRGLGVEWGQGYHLARPDVPPDPV